jgi:outer membrane protein assembly factor BamB
MKPEMMNVLIAGSLLTGACLLNAADWPQYRGPAQNGSSPEKISVKWPASGPKQLWRVDAPAGFSSFAVAEGKAATLVVREVDGATREVCLVVDATTGKELWSALLDTAKFDGSGNAGTKENGGGDGPRCTPAISNGKIYVFTPSLVLYCLDAANGETLWTKDLIKEHQGRNIGWKNAASPVVDGNLIFVACGGPGQSLLGLNKVNGQVVWKAHDEQITHATPVVATILGVRQVIFFMQSGLVSVNAETGAALWKFPFRYNVSTASSAVVSGDIVYCSAGYGVGGGACKITKSGDAFTATELWKIPGDNQVANHWSTPFCKDGYLYGMFSFKKYGSGPLKCVELATGQVKWQQPGFGAGQAILAGDHILALADDGQLVVVEATPEAYREVSRAKVVNGKCWSMPTLSNGRVYVRSTKEGVCLDVSPKTAAN